MTVYFSADSHFGHQAILTYSRRPFTSVALMDATLIANWNATVRQNDDVWFLGDFAFGTAEVAAGYLKRLRGRKHLIRGNHDKHSVQILPGWASSQSMAEIKLDGHRVTLLHYGMRVWPGSNRGSIHLYGHSHGMLPGDRQSLDVGVDCWDYQPVTLPEIQARLATLPERGGHRE